MAPLIVDQQSLGDELTEAHIRVGAVDAILWLPAGPPQPPVVLLGHGGSGHKGGERQVRLATRLATEAGLASLAIDGPYHGARAVPGDYRQSIAREGPARVHDRMRADWLAALDATSEAGLVDGRSVAFLGMSMGARYGIAVCAALESRLRCAVLGKFGLTCHPDLAQVAADDIIRAAAVAISAPVLMHVQWDDELFPRDGQFELFDRLASPDKQLRVRTGGHTLTRPDDEDAWCDYLRNYLAPAGG